MPRSFLVKKHQSAKKLTYGRHTTDTHEPHRHAPLHGADVPRGRHPLTPGPPPQRNAPPPSSSLTPRSVRAGRLHLLTSAPVSMLAPPPEPEPAESYTKPNLDPRHVGGDWPCSEGPCPPAPGPSPWPPGPGPQPRLALLPGTCPGGGDGRRRDSLECVDCHRGYLGFCGGAKHKQLRCEWSRKSFSCKYCDKEYGSLGALKMHIRTHTLPCVCTLCGKAFSRPWLLQGHIRTHTGEKPFSCLHCSRAFADRSNLRAHLQTHSEVKKYQCFSCFKTFSRISLLAKHQETGCPLS